MDKIERVDGWEDRLNRLISSRVFTPFSWGGNDCVSFSSDCIKAVCEWDPIERFRGLYDTEAQAFKNLENYGRAFPQQISGLFQPLNRIRDGRIWSGDVALIRHDLGISLGIVHVGQILSTGDRGLVTSKISDALRIWGVGHE